MKTTHSAFDSIHLTLAIMALVVSVGFCVLAEAFVAPELIKERAEAVLSVIRSHENDLVLNKTRPLRDELLRSRTIQEDQNFSHFFSDEREKVLPLLSNCHFLSDSICVGPDKSIFFAANSANTAPKDNFKFAVALEADLSHTPIQLRLWEGVVTILLGFSFWLIHRAIQRKEKYLLSRLETAKSAFTDARIALGGDQQGQDEFDAFGRAAQDLVRLVEDYKAKFERKTRLEQLGLIVGQVSHDLKAPFNEAENFLSAMPLLLESAKREDILEATESLLKRIRFGKDAVQQAIQFAKRTSIAKDEVSLSEVFKSIQARSSLNAKLKGLSVSLSIPGNHKVLGDQIQLETAFLNLLENSAEEKNDASVQIQLSLANSNSAKIIITDNGGGVPEELLEKIFEPLATFKAGGSGLGLYSTKEILAIHGGEIRALPSESGATFEVILPLLKEVAHV